MKKFIAMVTAFIAVTLPAALAFAQEAGGGDSSSLKGLGIGLGIGVAAMGGGIGQGKAASAALEGIARNPNASGQIFVPMILGLAFIESLVILTWLIQFTFGG